MKYDFPKTLKYLLAIILAFMLNSCEGVLLDVEVHSPIDNVQQSTNYLISRIWTDEWTDENGTLYRQELSFYYDHVGTDYISSVDKWGFYTESSYNFTWDWKNSRCTSLRLKYGPADYSYMENIVMGGNTLDCILDGQRVYFIGK